MVIIRPPLPFIIWQKLSDKFKRDATPQSAVIKDLENVCIATHRDLSHIAEAFRALDNFPLNGYRPIIPALGAPSLPPFYVQISEYYNNIKEAGEAKYELHKVREVSLLTNHALNEIAKLKDYLRQSQSMLKDKTAWLWKLIKSQNYATTNNYDTTKLADFEAFSNDEQEAINKLANEAMQIFCVITAKCVNNGRWRATDEIIQNPQSGLGHYVFA